MERDNPEILFKNHFKIYVLLKDKIIFERELEKQDIDYFCDIDNQLILGNTIRYKIQDSDSIKLDKIFIENGIIAYTETIPTIDYKDGKKVMKVYLIIGAIVAGIMMLIAIIKG